MSGRWLTEAQAAEVWCPWAIGLIVAHDDRSLKTANRARNGSVPESCRCLGSKCAAWVWHGPDVVGEREVPRESIKGEAVDMHVPRGKTLAEAKPPKRPANVPITWEPEDDEGFWWWREDDASYQRRFAEAKAQYGIIRPGSCGNVRGDSFGGLQGLLLQMGGKP